MGLRERRAGGHRETFAFEAAAKAFILKGVLFADAQQGLPLSTLSHAALGVSSWATPVPVQASVLPRWSLVCFIYLKPSHVNTLVAVFVSLRITIMFSSYCMLSK